MYKVMKHFPYQIVRHVASFYFKFEAEKYILEFHNGDPSMWIVEE